MKTLTVDQWKATPKAQRRKDEAGRRFLDVGEGAWELVQIVGKRYRCPNCGRADDWVAHYVTPYTQLVSLTVNEDGSPEPDYEGGLHSFDDFPDEKFQCQTCDYEIVLGITEYVSTEVADNRLRDAAALTRIHKILDGREWSGADDLEAIAEAVRATGREVREPQPEEGEVEPDGDAMAALEAIFDTTEVGSEPNREAVRQIRNAGGSDFARDHYDEDLKVIVHLNDEALPS